MIKVLVVQPAEINIWQIPEELMVGKSLKIEVWRESMRPIGHAVYKLGDLEKNTTTSVFLTIQRYPVKCYYRELRYKILYFHCVESNRFWTHWTVYEAFHKVRCVFWQLFATCHKYYCNKSRTHPKALSINHEFLAI